MATGQEGREGRGRGEERERGQEPSRAPPPTPSLLSHLPRPLWPPVAHSCHRTAPEAGDLESASQRLNEKHSCHFQMTNDKSYDRGVEGRWA